VEVIKEVYMPPQIIEKIVEVPVDRIVERIIEVPVDRIVEKIVEIPRYETVYQDRPYP